MELKKDTDFKTSPYSKYIEETWPRRWPRNYEYGAKAVLPGDQIARVRELLGGTDIVLVSEKLGWYVPAPINALGFLTRMLLEADTIPNGMSRKDLEKIQDFGPQTNGIKHIQEIDQAENIFPVLYTVHCFYQKLVSLPLGEERSYTTDALRVILWLVDTYIRTPDDKHYIEQINAFRVFLLEGLDWRKVYRSSLTQSEFRHELMLHIYDLVQGKRPLVRAIRKLLMVFWILNIGSEIRHENTHNYFGTKLRLVIPCRSSLEEVLITCNLEDLVPILESENPDMAEEAIADINQRAETVDDPQGHAQAIEENTTGNKSTEKFISKVSGKSSPDGRPFQTVDYLSFDDEEPNLHLYQGIPHLGVKRNKREDRRLIRLGIKRYVQPTPHPCPIFIAVLSA